MRHDLDDIRNLDDIYGGETRTFFLTHITFRPYYSTHSFDH